MSKVVESFRTDLPTRTFRVTNGFNEAIYLAANEPSLGMYRLQEHIQTNVPKLVMQKQALQGVSGLIGHFLLIIETHSYIRTLCRKFILARVALDTSYTRVLVRLL